MVSVMERDGNGGCCAWLAQHSFSRHPDGVAFFFSLRDALFTHSAHSVSVSRTCAQAARCTSALCRLFASGARAGRLGSSDINGGVGGAVRVAAYKDMRTPHRV